MKFGGSATVNTALNDRNLALAPTDVPDDAAKALMQKNRLKTTAQRPAFSDKGTWFKFATPTTSLVNPNYSLNDARPATQKAW